MWGMRQTAQARKDRVAMNQDREGCGGGVVGKSKASVWNMLNLTHL